MSRNYICNFTSPITSQRCSEAESFASLSENFANNSSTLQTSSVQRTQLQRGADDSQTGQQYHIRKRNKPFEALLDRETHALRLLSAMD